MKKTFIKVVAMTAVAISLSGCVGSMAVTGKLMQFNVEVVDNRYARAGVNFLLSPFMQLQPPPIISFLTRLSSGRGKTQLMDLHIFLIVKQRPC